MSLKLPEGPAGYIDLTPQDVHILNKVRAHLARKGVNPGGLRPIDILDMDEPEPIRWLLDGIMEKESFAILAGQYGTYKSFVALAWALAVATGTTWMEHKAAPGKVLYIAGEGQRGIQKRALAWMEHSGHRPEPGMFQVYPRSIRLNRPEDVAQLRAFVNEEFYDLVVVDTLHRAMPGVEENSSKEVGACFDAMDAIRDDYGFAVLYVHHTGHIATRARGSSSIEDDADSAFVIELEDGISRDVENSRILRNSKQKDSEPLTDKMLVLTQVQIGLESVGVVEAIVADKAERKQSKAVATRETRRQKMKAGILWAIHRGAVTKRAIRADVSGDNGLIDQLIVEMFQEGWVAGGPGQEGDGHYRLTVPEFLTAAQIQARQALMDSYTE